MGKVILSLRNINKLFGENRVLNDINLDVEKGNFVTFLGPSGCGKTTLLRTIAGFYNADEGEVIINGNNVGTLPPHRRNTPMVFQEYALFPHLSVFDNIAYGLNIKKTNKTEIEKRVKDVMGLMQLDGFEKRYPYQLSGGQQQRVAIARALIMNPDILLLDEPLSNLDAKLRESVRVELRQIQQKLNLTVIYVTHDQSEALSMSDRVVVFNRGHIDQYGTPREIYFKPKTKYVADFIGTTNFIEGTVINSENGLVEIKYETDVLTAKTNNNLQLNDKVTISIRPESIKLEKEVQQDSCNNIKGKIHNAMFLGEKVRYFVIDEHNKEWIVDMFDTDNEVLNGDVYLNIPIERVHLILE